MPALSEEQVDRIAAKVAMQLAGLGQNAPATVTPQTGQALAPQAGDIHTQSCAVTNEDSTTSITSGAIDNLLGELRHSDGKQLTPRTSDTNTVLFDLPLDYHVPLKLKTKIWSNEYVDFSELLHSKDDDDYVMSVKNINSVPSLSVSKTERKSYLTYQQWGVTFEVFVAIHSVKFPQDTPGLMKYASLIRLLFQNGQGWFKYDRSFRQLRELDPTLPWWKIQSTIWSVATLAKSIKLTSVAPESKNPPLRRGPAEAENPNTVKGFCWSYNATGSCSAGWPRNKWCRHKHVCTTCKAPHPRCHCPSGSRYKRSTYKFERRRF